MKKALLVEILIWVLALTLIILGGVFVHFKTFVEPNLYTINFKDVDGITKGSPVRFMGINVGYVRKLASVDKSVAVQIYITKKDLKIPNGTLARVEFYGLGGSKSIELMPSNIKEANGIITSDTIRIGDVTKQARTFVQILEIIDKFVQSLDEKAIQDILKVVENTSPDSIKQFENEMNKAEASLTLKSKDIKKKQVSMGHAIDKANNIVLRINKFVKK